MSNWQPEIPLTFESSDALTVATFPLADYEWESNQPLLVPSVRLVGADYEYDQLGTGIARKGNGVETIRAVIYEDEPSEVDATLRAFQSAVLSIGLGKLWSADSTSARFWAWARATAMPSIRWSAGDILHKTISIEFRRQSDWVAEDPTVVDEAIAETPHNFTLTNPGNQRVLNAVVTLSGVWHGPVIIHNTTNGYAMEYTGTAVGASNNDQLRWDAGANRLDLTSDGGANWISVYEFYSGYVATQVQQMILEVGDNDFTVTDSGSPNATLEAVFYV